MYKAIVVAAMSVLLWACTPPVVQSQQDAIGQGAVAITSLAQTAHSAHLSQTITDEQAAIIKAKLSQAEGLFRQAAALPEGSDQTALLRDAQTILNTVHDLLIQEGAKP